MDSGSEDGEIVEDAQMKPDRGGRGKRGAARGMHGGHQQYQGPKRFRGRGGSLTMPVYSTNQSILQQQQRPQMPSHVGSFNQGQSFPGH